MGKSELLAVVAPMLQEVEAGGEGEGERERGGEKKRGGTQLWEGADEFQERTLVKRSLKANSSYSWWEERWGGEGCSAQPEKTLSH